MFLNSKPNLNFSPKVKGIHKDKYLTCDEVPSGIPHILTHRMVLSQVSSIFDPLGLLTPFVLQSKLLLRALCSKDASKENSWDEPINEKMRGEWMKLFKDLFTVEDLEFPRCVKVTRLWEIPH